MIQFKLPDLQNISSDRISCAIKTKVQARHDPVPRSILPQSRNLSLSEAMYVAGIVVVSLPISSSLRRRRCAFRPLV